MYRQFKDIKFCENKQKDLVEEKDDFRHIIHITFSITTKKE